MNFMVWQLRSLMARGRGRKNNPTQEALFNTTHILNISIEYSKIYI